MNTQIRGQQLKDAFFGAGLIRNGSDADIMDVKVDESSIEIFSDALQIKASGVTNDMLAGSIADGKLVEDYIKTSEVDGSSIEFAGGTLNVKASGVTNDMLAGSIADGKLAEDYIKTSEVDGSTIEFAGGTLNIVANGVGATEIDLTGTYDYTSGTVKVGTPSATTDATNKSYVDNLINGLQWKDPARAKSIASDGNITLSGVSGQSLDGISLVADDRVLLTEQTDASENGIWVVKSGSWERPSDFPTDGDAVNASVLVSEGDDNADTQWTCTNNADADTIDTHNLSFVQISGAGIITAGAGLVKDGNTLDVQVDDSTIEINADTLRVKDDGITNAKLANMTRGTVKVGGTSNAPTDLDAKTDGYVLIGDGTDVNSVAVSGDVTITNAGVTSIGADKVTKTMVNADVAGNGILQNVDGSLELNPDDSSIEIASGEVLQVKALGITNAMLAGSIADTKLAEDYIKTSEVDGSSIEFAGGTLNVKAGGVTNDMLAGSIADGKLTEDYIKTSEVDGSSIEFAGGTLNVKALGIVNSMIAEDTIAESKIDIHNAPTEGKVLGYTSNGMEWVAGTDDSVVEGDIQLENESANCNGVTVAFTLSNTPVTNSVQIFLNGLLQEAGSGKDYTVSGTTVTFATAPETGDILICHYVSNN